VLVRRYEDFVAQWGAVRESASGGLLRFRSLRLPKTARSVLHVAAGLGGVLLYQFVLSQAQALTILASLLAVFTGLEISRRFSQRFNDFMVYRVFGAISRPQERYRINSASYYLLALTLITWLTPRPAACAAVLVLAFGDPTASWIGNRWGRLRLANDKSLEGSLAFFGISAPVLFAYLLLVMGQMSAMQCLLAAASICAVGTLVELFSHDLDDNFTVPVACALTGLLWF
jgi:dolichol kinase